MSDMQVVLTLLGWIAGMVVVGLLARAYVQSGVVPPRSEMQVTYSSGGKNTPGTLVLVHVPRHWVKGPPGLTGDADLDAETERWMNELVPHLVTPEFAAELEAERKREAERLGTIVPFMDGAL